MCFTRPLHPS
jgi:hypothetical protein